VNNPLAFVRANLGEITRLSELTHAWRAKHESPLADALAEMGELAQDALAGSRGSSARCRTCAGSPPPRRGRDRRVARRASCSTRCACSSCAERAIEIRTHFAPKLPACRFRAAARAGGVAPAAQRAAGARGHARAWIEVETGAAGDSRCACACATTAAAARALRERIHEPYPARARDPSAALSARASPRDRARPRRNAQRGAVRGRRGVRAAAARASEP
jgi:hypothetical protein